MKKRARKPKTYHGDYYFPTFEAARTYARKHNFPTDRIISYTRGWAIQLKVSGPYVGPDTKRSKNPVKKRRTRAQIAATKKLVAFNKRKRGKKVAKRTRKKRRTPAQIAATKKLVKLNKIRVGRTASRKRKKNPKKVSAKSHLWVVFRCRGKSIVYIKFTAKLTYVWTGDLSHAVRFRLKDDAVKVAQAAAKRRGNLQYQVGVASSDTTAAQIAAQCTKA